MFVANRAINKLSWERVKKDVFSNWQNFFFLTLGAIIMAFGFRLFFYPNNIAPGGVSGLSLILLKYIPMNPGLLLQIMNIPLLILGFYNLGRFKFLIRTTYVVLVMNAAIDLFGLVLPAAGISEDLLLNSLFGGVASGIGFGMVLRAQGNSGGTGVLSRVLQLKTGWPISQIYIITDGTIILLLGFFFGWENALYSMVALFVAGLATDYALEGPSIVRMVMIVTKMPKEVAAELHTTLRIGVTKWDSEGTFNKESSHVLMCTVMRSDVDRLSDLVAMVDSKAFVVVVHGHNARGGILGKNAKVLAEKAEEAKEAELLAEHK